MNTDRRRFLGQSGALTAAGLMGSLGTWGIESARAAGGDFKALVGVFLFGGNDSNNMVVPTDASRWNDYATVRSAASGIGHVQATLQPVTDAATGNPYGLHPNLPDLKAIYDQGRMAIIANAGTLLAPIPDIATYKTGAGRPPNLFSHSDQQVAWMGQEPNVVARTGWGGRAADRLASVNASALIPSTVSVSGNQVFAVGNDAVPFVIPGNGGVSLSGQGSSGVQLARYNIRVNSIAPGWIMTQRQIEKWLTPEGEAELMTRQCLKRKLVPDEIAKFTVFLASDEASACTNQQYVVDGGWV